MLKLFILIHLLIPYSVYAYSYDNEIKALIIFMEYEKGIEKTNNIKKGYLSIPIDNCISIIKVKKFNLIKSYEVNICNKSVFKI